MSPKKKPRRARALKDLKSAIIDQVVHAIIEEAIICPRCHAYGDDQEFHRDGDYIDSFHCPHCGLRLRIICDTSPAKTEDQAADDLKLMEKSS